MRGGLLLTEQLTSTHHPGLPELLHMLGHRITDLTSSHPGLPEHLHMLGHRMRHNMCRTPRLRTVIV